MRILLARHGETGWNAAGRVQGASDTDLNDNGRIQAEELGRQSRAMKKPPKGYYGYGFAEYKYSGNWSSGEKVVEDDFKGVGPFILACSELEKS